MLLTISIALLAQHQGDAAPEQAAVMSVETPRDAVIGSTGPKTKEAGDDAIPLPTPAVIAQTPHGEAVIQAASGDPFFLGFAAGAHYPAASESIDSELFNNATNLPHDGRPARETFGFVMFSKRMTPERFEQLRQLGARVLGFHPFYCAKVAIQPQNIDDVAALDFVRWIGVPRSWQKLHPHVSDALASAQPGDTLEVYINVFDSDMCAESSSRPIAAAFHADPAGVIEEAPQGTQAVAWMSNGWQQRVLQSLGVEIASYADNVRAFEARIDPARIEELVALDFVQFIDLVPSNVAMHDESMPLIDADRGRAAYDGSTTGTAILGVIDSGCDIAHAALDPYIVGWDFTSENWGPFNDGLGHGSHVSGTMFGNADVEPSWQGAAPALGFDQSHRVYDLKMINSTNGTAGVTYSSVLTQAHTAFNDGTYITQRPMVLNNSYGAGLGGSPYIGTETQPRMIDDETYDYGQLYMFAAGNFGPGGQTISDKASAKNAMTVGAVDDFYNSADPGAIGDFSSRGPCGDGRWKPNVVAPGRWVMSCSAGSGTGYGNGYGTSMASPHVTGVAAQLCDHYSFLRYNPSTLAAVLMAGAITKNDEEIFQPSQNVGTHLNTYGAGRIDAYKSHYGDSQQALYFWGVDLDYNDSTYVDFPVNSGATRVTTVVHYEEVAASAGGSAALINDFDTYIDEPPLAAGNNTGEYVLQQSPRDNTELRMIDNPTATGTWRLKIWPQSTVPFQVVHVGICVIVTYGDTTPDPTFNVTSNDYYVQPGDDVQITATYSNPTFIASAVYVDSSSTGSVLTGATTTLVDGPTTDLLSNQQSGRDIELGNIVHGTSRFARWTTHWNSEGAKSWSVTARSDNAVDKTDSVTIYVDGTEPGLVPNLHSTSHTANAWSNDNTIAFDWDPATDNLSGIDGYGVSWGSSIAGAAPANAKDVEQNITSYTTPALADGSSWYFAVRSVDNSGNWDSGYASAGPYKIDTAAPTQPSGLSSSTHTLGVQSCGTNVTVHWTASTDALSGVAGYIGVWTIAAVTNPIGAPNIAANATSFAQDIGSSPLARYFHIRAVDNAGNLGNVAHFGPIYANSASVVIYCTGKTNSLGCVPAIGTNGAQPSKSAGTFAVTCSNTLNNKNGLLFFGFSPANVAFQGGTKCVAAPTYRGPNQNSGGSPGGNDCSGVYSLTFSTAFMNTYSLDPGDAVYAQWWTRDPASASTTGLSNAVQFTVCE